MLIDTHSHLFNEYYDNIQEVLDRAKANGIEKVVVAADNIKSCYEVIDNSNKYDNYYFCLGIHPEDVDDNLEELEKIIEDNKDNPKFVAIGEIGLDYHYVKRPMWHFYCSIIQTTKIQQFRETEAGLATKKSRCHQRDS